MALERRKIYSQYELNPQFKTNQIYIRRGARLDFQKSNDI